MKIVITGSTKGIGLALTRECLKLNDQVVICSSNQENVDNALKNLESEFPNSKIFGIKCDVKNYLELENLGKFAFEKMGAIDIWWNNAGIKDMERSPLKDHPNETLKEVFEVNVIGLLYACKVAINIMLKQGYGKIINMEGMGSNGMPSPNAIAYGTSKSTIPYIKKTLVKELKGTNIGIHDSSPGMVLTDLLLTNAEPNFYKIFNLLAEKPETVAEYLVPRVRKLKGTGKTVNYLTNLKAMIRFLTFWKYKNRWFDKDGNKKF